MRSATDVVQFIQNCWIDLMSGKRRKHFRKMLIENPVYPILSFQSTLKDSANVFPYYVALIIFQCKTPLSLTTRTSRFIVQLHDHTSKALGHSRPDNRWETNTEIIKLFCSKRQEEDRQRDRQYSLQTADMTQTIKFFFSATPVIICSHHGTGNHFAQLLHLFFFTKRSFLLDVCGGCYGLHCVVLLCRASRCL